MTDQRTGKLTITVDEETRALAESILQAIMDVRDASPRARNDADSGDIVAAILPLIEAHARELMADAFGEYADLMAGIRLSRDDEIENMRDVARGVRSGEYPITSPARHATPPEEG